MIFGGVFEKFPRLKVAFAHGGGSFPMTLGRIEHGFQVRPDLCAIDNDKNPRDYIGKFYLDTLGRNVIRTKVDGQKPEIDPDADRVVVVVVVVDDDVPDFVVLREDIEIPVVGRDRG